MKLHQVNQILLKKNENKIKKYLNQLLNINKIINDVKTIEEIYINMNKYIEDKSAIIIGIFDKKDEIYGFIWGYKRKELENIYLHINYFIVDEMFRGKGYGTMLIDEICKIAKTIGINKIELMVACDNTSSREFYKNKYFYEERILMRKNIK